MEWPANYTFFSANVCVVFICERRRRRRRRQWFARYEAARPPLTKHDPGFNFIDRKKSLAILDYVDLAYIDI